MEPRIVSVPAFTVVGMKYRGKNEQNEIPQLWSQFGPRMGEIKHKVDRDIAYGVMGNYDENTGEFDYVAAIEVERADGIPTGMASWVVPEQTYAVFVCTLPTIRETFQHVYETWLPQSGYQRGSDVEFEFYDADFDPQDPSSEMQIYIPIKK
jgi:AraC family transcriptional regulator